MTSEPLRQLSPAGDTTGPVTPDFLVSTIRQLRASGPALTALTTAQIANRLERATLAWLDEDASWLDQAATATAATTGYSPEMVRWSLADLLRRLTAASMVALVETELGAREPFQAPRAQSPLPCARAANPPALVFQVLASTVPPVAIESIALALLARGPLLIKTATNEPAIPRLFLDSLRKLAPDLANSVAVLTWPGGHDALDSLASRAADVVTVYGGDDTVNALLARCRFPTRFFGYGHRVSFGIIGPDDGKRGPARLGELARGFALDAAVYDQRGCMSPHCLFVARAAPWTLEEVARALVDIGFPHVEQTLPRGRLSTDTAAALLQELGVAEFTAQVFRAETAAVVVHREPGFRASPGGRTLHLVPYDDEAALLSELDRLRGAISTVGLDYPRARRTDFLATLGRLGVRRITSPGRMQRPVWLRDHDGRPRLGDWVEWTDVEPLY